MHEYRGETATLVLKSEFTQRVTVHVNIQHILETARRDLLEVGAWLNIVGYVVKPPSIEDKQKALSSKGKQKRAKRKMPVVEATMFWSAGAIKLDSYQSAVRSYQSTTLQNG